MGRFVQNCLDMTPFSDSRVMEVCEKRVPLGSKRQAERIREKQSAEVSQLLILLVEFMLRMN